MLSVLVENSLNFLAFLYPFSFSFFVSFSFFIDSRLLFSKSNEVAVKLHRYQTQNENYVNLQRKFRTRKENQMRKKRFGYKKN